MTNYMTREVSEMKKLKTWQIVLLVIFYPVGICVLIYRLVKGAQLKREAMEIEQTRRARIEQEEAEREAKRLEEQRLYDDLMFKIVGVTYKNEDRHSRQAILRKLKFGDYPFNGGDIDLGFKKYEFEGEPAVGVFLAGEQVGNIAKDDLPLFLPRMDRFVSCQMYEVTGGGTLNGERLKYGLKLFLRFKKE